MSFKNICEQLNIPGQCRKYGLPLWQCPQFLFLVMGIITIISIISSFYIGNRYVDDPQFVALIVIFMGVILFVISYIITQNFERLAEISRMKTEFVSIVSHQLRSPISNLRWAIDFLMSGGAGEVPAKQMEYCSILKENSDRMRNLVSDLLIVSRIEQGRLPIKNEKVDLGQLIKEAVKGVDIFARASNVKMKLQTAENLPGAVCDPSQIKLVIENLLDNAIRYAKGGGSVSLELSKKNDRLYFKVKDQGVGIPQADQKYIFQKFFRSSNVLTRQTEGSGLGLYIAKSIIEKSKGKIGFQSQEGAGSTFWFTLPIK